MRATGPPPGVTGIAGSVHAPGRPPGPEAGDLVAGTLAELPAGRAARRVSPMPLAMGSNRLPGQLSVASRGRFWFSGRQE